MLFVRIYFYILKIPSYLEKKKKCICRESKILLLLVHLFGVFLDLYTSTEYSNFILSNETNI